MATIRLKQLKSRDNVLLQEKLTSDGHEFVLSRFFYRFFEINLTKKIDQLMRLPPSLVILCGVLHVESPVLFYGSN